MLAIIVLSITVFTANCYSADRITDSIPSPTPVEFSNMSVSCDSATVTVPFTRAGNLILIKAKADTTQGTFILDIGAPGLVLNITYFRQYATKNMDGQAGGITGYVDGAMQTTIRQFSFAGINYTNADADLINLGHIETQKGIRILGLLGTQLFERFEIIIDYQKKLLLYIQPQPHLPAKGVW